MSLLDVLACPCCKQGLTRSAAALRCAGCGREYPVVDGVPVLLPPGITPQVSLPGELEVFGGYEPFVQQLLDSLPPDEPILDIGAGNRSVSDPRIVRMDFVRTPWLDVVGDAHALPFRDASLGLVYTTAVFEHLRQPFVAAQEIRRVLKPGGHVLADCAFVFPFHDYPAVYFNASQDGLRSLFAEFTEVLVHVTPWQMPSYSLRAFLAEYLRLFAAETPREREFAETLQGVLRHPLHEYDRRFTQAGAARIAAATTYLGAKRNGDDGTLLPQAVQDAHAADAELRRRYPQPWSLLASFDEQGIDSLFRWARDTGARENPGIRQHFESRAAFDKHL
jgi:uncharacterized protein YbaR (Trm112 family)/SAM-dependent methyltransferase